MRKNIKLLMLILFVVSLLTGCANANYLVTINSDGSVDLRYALLFEKSLLQFSLIGSEDLDLNQNPVDRYEQYAKDKGYTTERITEGELEGFIATKKIKNLNKMELLNFESGSDVIRITEESYKYRKGLFRNHYSIKLKLDRTPEIPEGAEEYMWEPDTLTYAIMSSLDLKLTINLPSKPANSNAAIVENDGKTHIWVPEYYSVTDVQIDGYIINPMGIYTGIAIIIILICVFVFFIIRKSGKKTSLKKNEENSKDGLNSSKESTYGDNEEISSTENSVMENPNMDLDENPVENPTDVSK